MLASIFQNWPQQEQCWPRFWKIDERSALVQDCNHPVIQRSNLAFLSRANAKLPVGVGEAIRERTRNLSGLPLTFLGILNNVLELHRFCLQILPMKLQVSILVLLRLMAVHWSLQLVTVFGPQMLQLFRMPEQTAETYLYYAVLAAPLVAVAALWFLAMPIARLVSEFPPMNEG